MLIQEWRFTNIYSTNIRKDEGICVPSSVSSQRHAMHPKTAFYTRSTIWLVSDSPKSDPDSFSGRSSQITVTSSSSRKQQLSHVDDSRMFI